MKIRFTSIEIAGAQIPCSMEVDLDHEEVFIETRNGDPRWDQRIRLDVKEQIEKQLRRSDETRKEE